MPNAHLATVDPAKVREYLLSDSHPVGQFKARFFRSLGFDPDRWKELEVALREHALQHPARPGPPSDYGTRYEIMGPIVGPSGVSREVLVAWMVRNGENVPRLVTAYPASTRP